MRRQVTGVNAKTVEPIVVDSDMPGMIEPAPLCSTTDSVTLMTVDSVTVVLVSHSDNTQMSSQDELLETDCFQPGCFTSHNTSDKSLAKLTGSA